eukprot:3985507-Amphidinium_carterae.1
MVLACEEPKSMFYLSVEGASCGDISCRTQESCQFPIFVGSFIEDVLGCSCSYHYVILLGRWSASLSWRW